MVIFVEYTGCFKRSNILMRMFILKILMNSDRQAPKSVYFPFKKCNLVTSIGVGMGGIWQLPFNWTFINNFIRKIIFLKTTLKCSQKCVSYFRRFIVFEKIGNWLDCYNKLHPNMFCYTGVVLNFFQINILRKGSNRFQILKKHFVFRAFEKDAVCI